MGQIQSLASSESAIPKGLFEPLPFVTEGFAPLRGVLRHEVEDFVVEEIPAYLPSGAGEHWMLKIEKRDRNTADVVGQIAKKLGVHPKNAGWAGLKDKRACTTQWISVWAPKLESIPNELEIANVRVLEAHKHHNKIRVGHLKGNRFRILLREVDKAAEESANKVFEALSNTGLANYYGEQRFGRSNLERAWAVLVQAPQARLSTQDGKWLFSVLQAALFNCVTAQRIQDGLLHTAVEGDLLRKEDTGGLFIANADELEGSKQRVRKWEVSATGPMFGSRMMRPETLSLERELKVLAACGLNEAWLEQNQRYGEGTRRPMRIRLDAWRVCKVAEGLWLEFELPKGAYATNVLRELQKS